MSDESALEAIEQLLQEPEANQEDANPGPEASVEPEAGTDTGQETPEEAETEAVEAKEEAPEEPDTVEVADTLDGIAEQLGVDPSDLGEHVKVKVGDEEVPLGKLAGGYMMQADYSKKTQALSQERETFNGERESFQSQQQQSLQYLAALEQEIEGLLGEIQVDPGLKESDPDRYNTLMWDRQDQSQKLTNVKGRLNNAASNFFRDQEHVKQQFVASESEKVAAKWPEVTRDKITELRGWAAEHLGMTNEEVANLVDHRMVLFVKEAKDNVDRLNKLEADKPAALKQVKKLPKLTKPGVKRDKTASQDKQAAARGRLRKSGNEDDLARMLLADPDFQ